MASKVKQARQSVCKIVAVIAGAAFFIAPLTDIGFAVMIGSVLVGVACLALYMYLDDDDTGSQFKLNSL